METITQKVVALKRESEKYSSTQMQRLIKASNHFDDLVAEGKVNRRGNHLGTLAEASKKRFLINSK